MAEIAGVGSISLSDLDAELRVQQQILHESSQNARQAQQLFMQSLQSLSEFNQRADQLGLQRRAMQRQEMLLPLQLKESQLKLEEAQRTNQLMEQNLEARKALGGAMKPSSGGFEPALPPEAEGAMLDRAINRLPPDLQLTPFIMTLKQQRLNDAKTKLEMLHTGAQAKYLGAKTAELGGSGSADFAMRASTLISDEELQRAKLTREKFIEIATAEGSVPEVRQGGAFKYARTIAGLGTAQKAGELGAKGLETQERQEALKEVVAQKSTAQMVLTDIKEKFNTDSKLVPETVKALERGPGLFSSPPNIDEEFIKKLKEEINAYSLETFHSELEPEVEREVIRKLLSANIKKLASYRPESSEEFKKLKQIADEYKIQLRGKYESPRGPR